MTQRAIAVIVLGEESEFTWRTSDPDGELQRLLSGSVTIREGKEASTLSWTVPDPSLEVANSIPLPQKRKNRVPVECWFGFAPKLEKVFTGHLVTVRATGLPGRLELSAVDKSKKGRRTPRTRNLTSTNAAGLLGSLAEDMGFILDLSEAPEFAESTEFAEVFQHGETNWELAQRIVESVGYRAMPRGSTIFIQPKGWTDAKRGPVEVVFGRNVANGFSFDIDELTRHTTPNIYDADGGPAYDADEFLSIDEEMREQLLALDRTGLNLAAEDVPSWTKQSAERALKAQARAKKLFTASITLTEAAPTADVDNQALLRGFGPRFSGAWNIEEVEHDLVQGRTTLDLYNGGSA